MNTSFHGNNLAIASFILAIFGLCGFICGGCIGASLFGFGAVVTSILALNQIIQEDPSQSIRSNKTLAWIGLIAGGAEIVIGITVSLAGLGLLGSSYLFQHLDKLR